MIIWDVWLTVVCLPGILKSESDGNGSLIKYLHTILNRNDPITQTVKNSYKTFLITSLLIFLFSLPLSASQLQDSFNKLTDVKLIKSRYIEVDHNKIKKEYIDIELREGKFFITERIGKHLRGMVFFGKGKVSIETPQIWNYPLKQKLVKRGADKPDRILKDRHFNKAFFLVSEKTLKSFGLFQKPKDLKGIEIDEIVEVIEGKETPGDLLVRKAKDLLYARTGRPSETRIPVIPLLKNRFNKDFNLEPRIYDFHSKEIGWFTLEYKPEARERIKIYSVKKKPLVGSVFFEKQKWASFDPKRKNKQPVADTGILHHRIRLETDKKMDFMDVRLTTEYKALKDNIRLIVLHSPVNRKGDTIEIDSIKNAVTGKKLRFMQIKSKLIVSSEELLNSSDPVKLELRYSVPLKTKAQQAMVYIKPCCTCPLRRYSRFIHHAPKRSALIGRPVSENWLPFNSEDRFTYEAAVKTPQEYIPVMPGIDITTKDDSTDIYTSRSDKPVDSFSLVFGDYNARKYSKIKPESGIYTLPKQTSRSARIANTISEILHWISKKLKKGYPRDRINIAQNHFRFVPKTVFVFCNGDLKKRTYGPSIGRNRLNISDLNYEIPGLLMMAGEAFAGYQRLAKGLRMTAADNRLKRETLKKRNRGLYFPRAVSQTYWNSQLHTNGYRDGWIVESLIKYTTYMYFNDYLKDRNLSEYLLGSYRDQTFELKETQDLPLVLAGYYPEDSKKLYARGALLLHTIRKTIGTELFLKTVRKFLGKYRFENVTGTKFFEVLKTQTAGYIESKANKEISINEKLKLARIKKFYENIDTFIEDWTKEPGYARMTEVSTETKDTDNGFKVLVYVKQSEEQFKHFLAPVSFYRAKDTKIIRHVWIDETEETFETVLPWKPEKIVFDENRQTLSKTKNRVLSH